MSFQKDIASVRKKSGARSCNVFTRYVENELSRSPRGANWSERGEGRNPEKDLRLRREGMRNFGGRREQRRGRDGQGDAQRILGAMGHSFPALGAPSRHRSEVVGKV